jgi:hypothetical protein
MEAISLIPINQTLDLISAPSAFNLVMHLDYEWAAQLLSKGLGCFVLLVLRVLLALSAEYFPWANSYLRLRHMAPSLQNANERFFDP